MGAFVSSQGSFNQFLYCCCCPFIYVYPQVSFSCNKLLLFAFLALVCRKVCFLGMSLSSCFITSRLCFSLKNERRRFSCNNIRYAPLLKSQSSECVGWSFVRGSSNTSRPDLGRNIPCRKSSVIYASWLPCSEIASGAFTLGTVAVLPFYASMVIAPRADFTKKLVRSSLPYMVLGALYAYLLYLSWTPDTIRLMFASKYWLPELPGMAKMFSSELTLASAWIHLLAVDLFAARQVYEDGVQHDVEMRHSVCLCLLFCPIGILAHFITKKLTKRRREKEHGTH